MAGSVGAMKYAFAVVAGLVVVATGAAAQQTVTVDAEVTNVDAPDELPGTYRLGVLVETDPQGPSCACQTTEVTLGVSTPDDTELWRHRPVGYTIDWVERALDPDREDEHVARGLVVIEADEDFREVDDRTVTVTVDARTSGPADGRAAHTEVQPATVELSPPEQGGDQGERTALAASQGGSTSRDRAAVAPWEPANASLAPLLGIVGLFTTVVSAGVIARLR